MIDRFSSDSRFEPIVGYSRAVRCGPFVFIAGTTATGAGGEIVGGASLYAQTRQALANVQAALERAGASLEHVVQTRLYVTDIERWEEVARAHGEMFGQIRPVSTMLAVARLIEPQMLVEIEATAYLGPRE